MEFLDTQIISYKFKGNDNLFNGDVKGRQISSVVALEFLEIMKKNENKAKMYLISLKGKHPEVFKKLEQNKEGYQLLKNNTDRLTLEFNGEFDKIVLYSNVAISNLINEKNINLLLLCAQNFLNKKEELKKFQEKAMFLLNNDIKVVPLTKEIVERMYSIYDEIKNEYNMKTDYRNSINDLLIVATAVCKKERLISQDKELNKVLQKCCDYLDVSAYSTGIDCIDYCGERLEKVNSNDNKGYVNNGWRFTIKKGAFYA